MYVSGPGMLPGDLPLGIAKGHPLFFFFINSLWMRIFGTAVTTVHILSLAISVSTLLATYFLVKKHVNHRAALIAICLLCVQSLFLAQATLVLPEMLITLFLVLSFDAYLSKKYLLFAIVGALMVLSKETTIIFILGFLLFHFILLLRQRASIKTIIKEILILAIPLAVYALFLLIHNLKFGSFFYEAHLGHIQLTKYTILKKLRMASEMTFWHYGRKYIVYSCVAAIAILLIRKQKLQHGNLFLLIILQTILFLAFSVVNFYTHRYMLNILTIFIILASTLLAQAGFKKMWINIAILLIIISFPLYFSLTKKTISDADLGYVEAVKVHQKMVEFCEEQQWQDKSISASFNLIYYLRDPSLGYITQGESFSEVSDLKIFRDSEIFLIDCTNNGKKLQIDTIKVENKLVKEIDIKQAWGEIYTNLPVINSPNKE
ncbi:glycosyltransferase family 39 protein [uncultured Draconibacterium sp.]|uniref:ArnT family glycosyltransferase n=1 Tax=uncultured Draconibacterium sp. TaxID=1573823 RepID=UPI002AA8543D|nr:glycosyltransferase family 39 protein [uncultured Draconibacterium sp.]